MSGLDFIYSDSMVTAFLAVLHFKLNDIVHLYSVPTAMSTDLRIEYMPSIEMTEVLTMSRNQRNIHSSAWTALQTSSRLKS